MVATEHILYRKAGSEDLTLLSQLRIDFMEDHWGVQTEEARNKLREPLLFYYNKAINEGSYVAFLAFAGAQCVATGGMVLQNRAGSFRVPNGKIAYVMNIFTYPGYRRQGIAKRILNLLEEEARSNGMEALELHATPSGENLYKTSGFQIHPEPTYRKLLV